MNTPGARVESALPLRFHHFGLAVRAPECSRTLLLALGYSIGEPVYDDNQEVWVQMCVSPSLPDVEIIYSTNTGGPLRNHLRSAEESIYHICFEAESIELALSIFRSSGNRVLRVSAVKPAPLFGGRPVAFYHVQGLGLVEILGARVESALGGESAGV
jgi:methylmalonyl-CoA/ethylmalonyl-CoA epimerase